MDFAAALGCGLKRLLCLLTVCAGVLPAANYYVTVAGLGGVPEYEKEFVRLAKELEGELHTGGGPDPHVITLSGAGATKQALSAAMTKLAGQIKPEDTFSLFLIGHGTFDGDTYKFNIPGPDVTAQEVAAMMTTIPARKQLVADMSSSSGAAFAPLASRGRIVITATKSGNEKNATVFARYWIEALRDASADTDKNGTVSALEAYTFATRKVKGYYDSEKLLASEHAMMTPVTDKTVVASLYPVLDRQGRNAMMASARGPAAQRAQQLEAQIEQLKGTKGSMKPDAYKQQLTALLLELARADAEVNP